jgi:Tfp pilus assembly protein PilO
VKKLSTREKVLLTILAGLLVSLSAFRYWYHPLITRQQALQLELAKLELQLTPLLPWEHRVPELARVVEDLRAAVEEARAATAGVPLPQFLVELERAARESRVSLRSTMLQQVTPEAGGPLAIEAFGTYHGLRAFLSALEGQPQLLTITGIHLVHQGQDLATMELSAVLHSGAIDPRAPAPGDPARNPLLPVR